MWSIFHQYQIHTHKGTGEKATEGEKQDNNVFKTLLLGWIQASLPGCTVSNFTTSWNDGRNLSALVDYCKPGLIPEHASLSPDTALENISAAMDLAWENFGIPKIMRVEDLATANPDARSVMLYLSHFCCPDVSGEESIGQKVLLEWIQEQIPKENITNFTTDWMYGGSLGALIDVISGRGFPDYEDMDPTDAVENCSKSLDAAERLLSIEKSVSAEAFAKNDTNQLIRMTYLTHLRFATPSQHPLQPTLATVEVCTLDSKERIKSKPEFTKVFITVARPKPDKYGVFVIENPHQYKVNIFEVAEAVDPVIGTTSERPPSFDVKDEGDRQYAKTPNKDDFHGSMTVVGDASLSAMSQGTCGKPTIDAVDEGDGQYAVTVAASEPDDYQVSIMWGGEHIPGSPFQLAIQDKPRPDCVVCTGPHYEVGSTQPVTLEVNAEKGGVGELSAICSDNKEGSVPVEISEDAPKRYTLRFTPPNFDTYTLSVFWSDEHVKGSPFMVDVVPLPPDASKCVVTGPKIPPEMSAPVTFKVDTSNAGHGELSAKAVSQTAGQASVDIEEKEPNVFDVFFICPKPDKYDLSMEWSSQSVPGSPFSLNLSTPNASKVTIARPPSSSIREGQPIVICFNTSQAGRGNLTATCSGSDVRTVNVVVTKNPDSTYNVEFVPPDVDLYTLSIFWNGIHIKRSPFTINLAPPIIGNVKIIGPTYSLSGPVELMLQTRGAGKGTVTGSCISIDKDTIPVNITETSHECYLLTFQPPKPNIYTFGVQFGGENLKGSPFCINTIPPDASKVIVTEPKALEVSEPIVFQCNVLEAGPGKLSSSCNGKSSGSVPVEITEKSQGKYNLSFNPPTPDIYTVRISLAGQQVPKSPFTINLLPPNAAMLKVMDVHVPDEAGLGKEAWIDLDCSETGPAELEGECSGEHVLKVPTEIVTLRPDVYRAKFEAKEGDDYRFAIRYGNEQLQDSPFIISVNSNTSLVHKLQIAIPQGHPPECIYVLPQVTTTKEETRSSPTTTAEELILYVGDPLQIAIHTQTAEQRSGVLSTTAVGEKTGQASITSLQDPDGQFDVTFVPTKLDRYTVEVAINGVPIPNSPIVVKCIARPADAGKCFLFGLDDSGGTFDVDKEITFGVNVQEAGEGTLSVTADGPCDDARRNQLTALQSSTDSCIYNVTYVPTAAGLHRVHVQWAQENVPGSPLKFEVSDGAEMTTYTENPVAIEITASGQSCKFKSHAIHKETGNRNEVNVASMVPNKLKLSFQASDPGIYLVHVFFDEHIIQDSPFEVNYCPTINQPDPTPEPQTVSGMIQRSESREVEFETALKEAETINIVEVGRQTSVRVKNGLPDSFRCVGEKAGEVDTLLTEEDEAESHIVSFVPITEDNYKLCVKCLSEEKCYLVKAVERKLLSPSYVHPNGAEALVEVNTCVNVVVLDDSTDDLTVSTIGSQGLNRSSVTGSVGDCIGIGFTPSTVGDYFVHIKKSNSEVGDSPYKVSVGKRDTKVQLKVEETSMFYERECFAEFLVSAIGPGKLKATISGPGKSNLKVTDDLDGTYSCALYPSIPGNYNISVMWNRYHIPGSPFSLTFKPKQMLSVVGLDLDNETLFLYVPYRFQVDCDDLPQGELHIKCKPSSAAIVTANLIPGTRRYQCEIIPQEEGNRAIKAVYKADLENYKSKRIIGSPFNVIFRPLGDASKCIIANTSVSHIYAIGDCALVSVSTEGAGKGKLTAFAANSASDGGTLPVTVTKVGKHKFDIEFSPDEPADYLVNVFFDGKNIPESPLRVVFCDPKEKQGLESHGGSGGATAFGLDSTLETSPSEPSNVRAYGPGLKSGFVGQEGNFIVSTGKAGKGVFGIRAKGPKGAFQLKIRQHPENGRTIIARYDPTIAGTYSFDITWSDMPIPGSPFHAVIVEHN